MSAGKGTARPEMPGIRCPEEAEAALAGANPAMASLFTTLRADAYMLRRHHNARCPFPGVLG